MQTRIDTVADGIHRLSTHVPEIGPTGFTFNQFLIEDEEPLLFHTGPRGMFPLVSEAIGRILPVDRLRWITFSHLESDESGAMNQFLDAAPRAEVAHGATGVLVSLNDLADRPPVIWADGQVVELGRHRIRQIDTPHVPHGWDARMLYDETTGTLLCTDLLSQVGDPLALTEDQDVLTAAEEAEDMFRSTSLTPELAPTIRRLAEFRPRTLAVMHGSSFSGDCAAVLGQLAAVYQRRLAEAQASASSAA